MNGEGTNRTQTLVDWGTCWSRVVVTTPHASDGEMIGVGGPDRGHPCRGILNIRIFCESLYYMWVDLSMRI